jgi:hypothetical protein
MKASVTICLAVLFVVAGFAQHSHSGTSDEQGMHSHHPTNDAEGVPGAVSGYLRDIACLLRNHKAGAATSAPTQDCLEKCVRGGSPLGVLTEEGLLFIPISKDSPDTSVRSQLLPYAGKYV